MKMLVNLDVNDHCRQVGILPSDTILDVVRHQMGLTGTKRGCDMGTWLLRRSDRRSPRSRLSNTGRRL